MLARNCPERRGTLGHADVAGRGAQTDERTARMTLDPLLLEVLACPEDKGPLMYFADEERLPVMLIDEATTVEDAEHDRLMAKADTGGVEQTMSPAGG